MTDTIPETTGAEFIETVTANFTVPEAQMASLHLAAEALDRARAAQDAIDEHGILIDGLHGPKANPAVSIKRDAVAEFMRLNRLLSIFTDEDAS
ncbi:MAG: Phage terminase, small subunit [Gaiellales bacterium]|jgi:phage terminase small subunit|nr:Phage terminase, small subunit [Gaiellales bacterium]